MTDEIIFGTGIPSWSFDTAVSQLSFQGLKGFRGAPIPPESDLLKDLRHNDDWPVRHQHARGTCNAFTVVAAEELRRFIAGGREDLAFFSEEHLYAKARGHDPDRLIEPPDDRALRLMEEGGATYLGQMTDALIDDGLADAADAQYRPDAAVNFVMDCFASSVETNAKLRKIPESELRHDVTRAVVGQDNKEWLNDSQRVNIADFFARQLSQGKPVAAAFAILNEAEYVWTGHYARASGHVRYPPDKIVEGKRPVAGHSVCLVGYAENPDAEEGNRWTFLFRNSYGTNIFGRDAAQFPDRLNTGLPGYGIISAADVSRFCWEYLTHASPEDIDILTGGGADRADII